jgi:hypothetical protein
VTKSKASRTCNTSLLPSRPFRYCNKGKDHEAPNNTRCTNACRRRHARCHASAGGAAETCGHMRRGQILAWRKVRRRQGESRENLDPRNTFQALEALVSFGPVTARSYGLAGRATRHQSGAVPDVMTWPANQTAPRFDHELSMRAVCDVDSVIPRTAASQDRHSLLPRRCCRLPIYGRKVLNAGSRLRDSNYSESAAANASASAS